MPPNSGNIIALTSLLACLAITLALWRRLALGTAAALLLRFTRKSPHPRNSPPPRQPPI